MQLIQPRSSRARIRTAALVATLVGALALPLVVTAAPTQAATRTGVVHAGARYARSHGYHIGIAVLDTATGRFYGAGDYTGTFASESIVKVFIATRLLVRGQMVGTTKRRAYKMITQSDDAIASSLYGRVGGDNLINWVKAHYHVPDLGYPPSRAGWWGNTHITPRGLVQLYAKLKRDPKVGPWLLHAMHHATKYGSDGTYQYFGIPSATTGWAIKQGWGADYDDWSASADFNTSGYVNGNRYAMAILARGPIGTYGSAISNMLTAVARRIMPNGQFPAPAPSIASLSAHTGPTRGGGTLTIKGSGFTQVRAVLFGHMAVRRVDVVSPHEVRVTIPAHHNGRFRVHVVTAHGATRGLVYQFIQPPIVNRLGRHNAGTSGGSQLNIYGASFHGVRQVLFGTVAGTNVRTISPRRLLVTVPQHAPGIVHVRVVDAYGISALRPGDRIRFNAGPRLTAMSPASGRASGGTRVHITGVAFGPKSTVSFGSVYGRVVLVAPGGKQLWAVTPRHHRGQYNVRVHTAWGMSGKTDQSVFRFR